MDLNAKNRMSGRGRISHREEKRGEGKSFYAQDSTPARSRGVLTEKVRFMEVDQRRVACVAERANSRRMAVYSLNEPRKRTLAVVEKLLQWSEIHDSRFGF